MAFAFESFGGLGVTAVFCDKESFVPAVLLQKGNAEMLRVFL